MTNNLNHFRSLIDQENSLERRTGIVNYIVILIRLSKDQGMDFKDTVDWIHSKYEQYGYFSNNSDLININSFIEAYIRGRKLLYDNIFIEEDEEKYIIKSELWYRNNNLESFFFFDIEYDEFFQYAKILAEKNATNYGFKLKIQLDENIEICKIYKEDKKNTSDLNDITVEDYTEIEHDAVSKLFKESWGGISMVSREKEYFIFNESIILAKLNDKILGTLVFRRENDEIEILTLESIEKYKNIGTKLLEFLLESHVTEDIKRIWLITSNDNLNAIRFYQKRNFSISNVYKNAINKARELKKSIPWYGHYGIPITDEIELEKKVIK